MKKTGKKATARKTAKKAAGRKTRARAPSGKKSASRSTAGRKPGRTVESYLQNLPEDRRAVVSAMRELIQRNLPQGYQETVNWGMISYEVPLELYPNTYNKQPLAYAGLAAQKNYNALYLLGVYSDPKRRTELEQAFAAAGKKLDMGKSCLRFRALDDLPLAAVGKLIASMPVTEFIARADAARARRS